MDARRSLLVRFPSLFCSRRRDRCSFVASRRFLHPAIPTRFYTASPTLPFLECITAAFRAPAPAGP
jgi:hypothetical protein